MTDQAQDSQDDGRPSRTPKSHKLPRMGFAEVKPLVEALVHLNGPSSRNLIFDQAGTAATGGTAKTKWAAMGYYGFRHDAGGGKFEVTERGRAFVSGDEEAEREAKQHALVSTGFRALISRFSTRPVAPTAIAGLLREDFGVPEGQAASVATMLVDLATEAGFIVDGVFKASVIEPAMDAVTEASPSSNGKPARPIAKPPASTVTRELPAQTPPSEQAKPVVRTPPNADKIQDEGQSGPFGVSVEIKIDAQHHTPQEIGEIVRQVRAALTTAD